MRPSSKARVSIVGGHTGRAAALCALLIAMCASMAICTSSAFGARNYECEVTGDSVPSPDECNGTGNADPEGHFGELYTVAVDNEDNLWVDNAGKERVEKFDPNGNLKARIEKFAPSYGGYARSIAYDFAAERAVLPSSGYNEIFFFDQEAHLSSEVKALYGGCCALFVGVDNSGGPSDGSIYVESYNASGFGQIFKLDKEGHPVSFTGSAPYIGEDPCGEPGQTCTGVQTIQGTPNGPLRLGFFPWASIGVNSEGTLYVPETGRAVVDEFNPAGEFIGEITGTPEGHFTETSGVAVDPTNDHVIVIDVGKNTLEEFDKAGNYLDTIEGSSVTEGKFFHPVGVAVDSQGRLYEADGGYGPESENVVHRFGPSFVLPRVKYGPETNLTRTSVSVHATVDPESGGAVTDCEVEYGPTTSYGSHVPCSPDPSSSPPGSNFTTATAIEAEISGLTAQTTYHYRVTATNSLGTRLGKDHSFTTLPAVNNLMTLPATGIDDKTATLNGSFDGAGEEDFFYFEWGTNTTYGGKTPVTSAGSAAGPTSVEAEISGLKPVTIYHYRVVVENTTGKSYGADKSFESLPAFPIVEAWSSAVHSDTATLNASVNPGGGDTTMHFEYGTSTEYGTSIPVPDQDLGKGLKFVQRSQIVLDLQPGTTYHYRVVATNVRGTVNGEDLTFRTFPFFEVLHDPCPNALVRKQVNAALLPDCRAYELASAANSGGYDVSSDLVPGQTQLDGYPGAKSRVLYSVHYGAIPGTGNPTNYGPDPYVATRGADGWSTRYVGIPADGTPSSGPFASRLVAADENLSTFAFGGLNICEPCFADGSSGIPVRMSDGSLVQGMAGSLDPGAGANPEGYVSRPMSADGSHLVFGSTQKFEPDGNSNGDISIYDRDLATGSTRVVSKTPGGGTMTGSGIGELDISKDGSRILIGKQISVDGDGNVYWHLYMNVGDSDHTIDLTPSASQGVLYDGMTTDGSQVFVTTPDAMAAGDTDGSADLYRLDVGSGTVAASLISTGNGAGDTDACNPEPNALGAHWNTVGAAADCSVVAVGGGGGVAAEDGTVYFLSPETLAPGAVADEPNLFAAQPGDAPRLVTTLGTENPLVRDSLTDNEVHQTGDFQVTPDGKIAVFTTRLSTTGYDNDGHSEVYRYDYMNEEVICASCPSTNARATGDATLASHGSSLTDDGRVFFTTTEPLVLRDLNGKKDAYEWSNGEVAPLSSGSSPLDSALLSVGGDGVDAFLFTHETFVPQDANGNVMKIYDAREDGGFAIEPPPLPCQASDECHGPGSPEPAAPQIRTVTGSDEAQKPSRRSCVKRSSAKAGKCGRKRHRHRHRKPSRRHG